jgi:hypothetical protein
MSGINTNLDTDTPTVREAATDLLDLISGHERGWNPADRWDAPTAKAIAVLRGAIAAEGREPQPIADMNWAMEGLGLMKAGEPVLPIHVRAIADAAGRSIELIQGFEMRKRADLHAIRRWVAGDEEREVAEALQAARLLVFAMRDEISPPAVHEAWDTLRKALGPVGDAIAVPPGKREGVWPERSDLVVWLLRLVERRPDFPVEEVEAVISDLKAYSVDEDGERCERASLLIRQLADAMIASERQAVVAGVVAETIRQGGGPVPEDVARLIIAARHVAFDGLFDGTTDEDARAVLRELDQASEAFADRVPWEDEPEERRCRICGCTETTPCEIASPIADGEPLAGYYATRPCGWALLDLCDAPNCIASAGFELIGPGVLRAREPTLIDPGQAGLSAALHAGLKPPFVTRTAPADSEAERLRLEGVVNRYLENAATDAGLDHAISDIPGAVAELAPGWTYTFDQNLANAGVVVPKVTLLKYEPDTPL